MLRGYVRYPDGRSERCDDLHCAHAAWNNDGATFWLDIQGEDPEVVLLARELFCLAQEPTDQAISGQDRPYIEEFEDWVFLLIYGVLSVGEPPAFRPHKIAIFFSERALITIRHEDSRTFNRVHARVQRKTSANLERGIDYLLFTLIDGLVDNYIACAEGYEQRINALEDQSLSDAVTSDVLDGVADVRQELIPLRRLIIAMREALAPLGQGAYEHILERLEDRFEHIDAHLKSALDIADAMRDALYGIRQNYHAYLAERTNALMKTLTLFAAFMAPLTVIAGLYGMNVRLYPASENPYSFWIILGSMAVSSAVLYWFLRWRRFL